MDRQLLCNRKVLPACVNGSTQLCGGDHSLIEKALFNQGSVLVNGIIHSTDCNPTASSTSEYIVNGACLTVSYSRSNKMILIR